MSKKKDHKNEKQSEEERLNRRVDAMLDPKQADSPETKDNNVPPLDIFKGTKTAPEVGGELLDEVDDVDAKEAPKPKRHPEPEHQDLPKDPVGQKDPLADSETDKAVTDIAAKEGNTLLELQDALGHKATRVAGRLAEHDRQAARRRRWAWFIFLALFIALVLLALPYNSYTCRWPVAVRLSVTTDILPSVCK